MIVVNRTDQHGLACYLVVRCGFGDLECTDILIAEYVGAQIHKFAYLVLVCVVLVAPSTLVDEDNRRQWPGTDSHVYF